MFNVEHQVRTIFKAEDFREITSFLTIANQNSFHLKQFLCSKYNADLQLLITILFNENSH